MSKLSYENSGVSITGGDAWVETCLLYTSDAADEL